MNNIAVMRNPDTLEWLGFAPVYDTGNSMLFARAGHEITDLRTVRTHTFTDTETKNLKNIKNTDAIDLSALPEKEEIREIYKKDPRITGEKLDRILNAYGYKVKKVRQMQKQNRLYPARETAERTRPGKNAGNAMKQIRQDAADAEKQLN